MNQLNHLSILWMRPQALVRIAVFVLALGTYDVTVQAQGKVAVVREVVELLTRRFSKEVAEEGSELLTRKVETFLVKYGDEGAEALSKVGPRAIQLADSAAANAAADGVQATRWLAKYGDEATWVVGNQSRTALASKIGDEATEAMIKHGAHVEPVLSAIGKPAANALRAVSEQNARRISMMSDSGELAKLGRSKELLDTIAKYGDKGMDFVWKNKGALAVGTAMVAFMADPEPFIEGTKSLADVAATAVIAPLANEIGKKTNWTVVIVVVSLCSIGYVATRSWLRRLVRGKARQI
jgi:hypothetical protein